MATVVCYCDTCQEGSRAIERLPNAPAVLDDDGGTAYVLYRKDRVTCLEGAQRLATIESATPSATNRVVAECCESAMLMRFDDARHWVPIYRARFDGDAPPVRWRICTAFRSARTPVPADAPSTRMYPPGLMWLLLESRLEMLLRP